MKLLFTPESLSELANKPPPIAAGDLKWGGDVTIYSEAMNSNVLVTVQTGLRIYYFVRFLTRLEKTSPSVQCVR